MNERNGASPGGTGAASGGGRRGRRRPSWGKPEVRRLCALARRLVGSLTGAAEGAADAKARSAAVADLERMVRSAERLEKLLAGGAPAPHASERAGLLDLMKLIEDGLDEPDSSRRDDQAS